MVQPIVAPREIIDYVLERLERDGEVKWERFMTDVGIVINPTDFYTITRRLLDRLVSLGVISNYEWGDGFRARMDDPPPVYYIGGGVVPQFLHDIFTDSSNRVGDSAFLFTVRGLMRWAWARAVGDVLVVVDHRDFHSGLARVLDVYKGFGMVSEYACEDAWASPMPRYGARCVIEVVGKPGVTPLGLGEYLELVPRVLGAVVGIVRSGDSRANVRNPDSPILVTRRLVARRGGLRVDRDGNMNRLLDLVFEREVWWLLDSMRVGGLVRGFRRPSVGRFLVFDN